MPIFNSPAFSEWTPTITGSGGMTWALVSSQITKYSLSGGVCFFEFRLDGTLGGVAGISLLLTPPVPMQTSLNNGVFAAFVNNVGVPNIGRGVLGYINAVGGLLVIAKSNGVTDIAYTLGAVTIAGNGFYRI